MNTFACIYHALGFTELTIVACVGFFNDFTRLVIRIYSNNTLTLACHCDICMGTLAEIIFICYKLELKFYQFCGHARFFVNSPVCANTSNSTPRKERAVQRMRGDDRAQTLGTTLLTQSIKGITLQTVNSNFGFSGPI